MRLHRLVLTLALAAAPSSALAGGYVELVGGASIPEGDDGHQALVETSRAFGARAGAYRTVDMGPERADLRLGVEVGATYTPFDDVDEEQQLTRTRVIGGVRLGLDHGGFEVFARAGAGLDRIHLDATGFLEALCGDPTIDGLALESGAGVAFQVGRLRLGGDAGLGVGHHRGDQPRCEPFRDQDDIRVDVLDNRTVDLDLRLFVGVRI